MVEQSYRRDMYNVGHVRDLDIKGKKELRSELGYLQAEILYFLSFS